MFLITCDGLRPPGAAQVLGVWANFLMFILVLGACAMAHAGGEKVYRTGLEAQRGELAVSPDGRQLVFETEQLAYGLRLLDLQTGKITPLPAEPGHVFGMPGWSFDGTQLVVVSSLVRDNYQIINDSRIALLDTHTWQFRIISSSEGVKTFPFFSADGKTVYYFKGKKRERGKTPASRYDLYVIELASGLETQLTHEEFYQAAKGDDNQRNVLFHATPNFYRRIKDAFGKESRNALFLYGKDTSSVSIINIDQSSGIFDFYSPQRDKAGNLYFIAAKARPGGGNFLWFLVRANRDGKQVDVLTELPISMGFDISRNTGDIYVTDKEGEELVIRRLTAHAAH